MNFWGGLRHSVRHGEGVDVQQRRTSWQRTFRGGVRRTSTRSLHFSEEWLLGTSPSRRGVLSRRRQFGVPAPEVDLRYEGGSWLKSALRIAAVSWI